MAKRIYEEKNIQAIADKIREKAGVNTTYKTSEMPDGIQKVYDNGYKVGIDTAMVDLNNAFDGGYTTGYNEGYADGSRKEYKGFWDNYKLESSDATCKFAGVGWNNETFKPNADMSFGNCYMIFRMSRISGDFVEILDNLGVSFSTAKASTLIYAFSYTEFTRLGEIDARNCTVLTELFSNSKKLKKIDRLILKNDGSNTFSSTFANCSSLSDIEIEGVIGNNIDFRSCPLGYNSIMFVVTSLSDKVNGKTLYLSKAAVDSAFETQYGLADGSKSEAWSEVVSLKPNWTITLVE